MPAQPDAETLAATLEAVERRLVRFGFDLHDGPMQDVAALAAELHHFRDQLSRVLEGHEHVGKLVGRVDDALARVAEIDESLRELAGSAESSAVLGAPLSQTLAELVDGVEATCAITLDLDPGLDAAELTDSQRIALVRVVQSALANVGRHSGASSAEVQVRIVAGGVEAAVTDDGRGFEVEDTLARAAADGRIGLVAMQERVRLLGGDFRLESKPGGPTRVAVSLPRWRPHSTST